MAKKYLKGFANFGVIPVTENTATSYKAEGERTVFRGARSCAPTDNREEYSIPGDDGTYEIGYDWTSTDLVVVVNEMSLKDLALICGGTVEEGTDTLEEGVLDTPPELAVTFSALLADGYYRLYRFYSAKCTGYKATHTTKGESTDAQTYELSFRCIPRKYDNKIRGIEDVAKGTALTWLDSIPTMPPETPAPAGN